MLYEVASLGRKMDSLAQVIDKWAEQNSGKQAILYHENIPDGEEEKQIDCLGNQVDYLISYNEFREQYFKHCYSFDMEGCLMDEGGCWGFSGLRVGFKSKTDLEAYQKFIRLNSSVG